MKQDSYQNNSLKVAVTSRSFSKHPILRAELLKCYPQVTFNDAGKKLVDQELINFLQGHAKAIVALEKFTEDVFIKLPELKVLSKVGVGLDGIDLAAMNKYAVKLARTPGVNKRSVAELVIAFALAMLRHLPMANKNLCAGEWRQYTGRQLSDRTVGIVGFGAIGQEVARLLQPFGCKILAFDVVAMPAFSGVQATSLPELLQNADVITLHLPLVADTYHLLNDATLGQMRQDAILINTARGGLVDEVALKNKLIDGRLAGAAFDVFEVEPPLDKELLQLPNFWGTPHIGGSSEEAILAMGRAAIAGLDNAQIPAVG